MVCPRPGNPNARQHQFGLALPPRSRGPPTGIGPRGRVRAALWLLGALTPLLLIGALPALGPLSAGSPVQPAARGVGASPALGQVPGALLPGLPVAETAPSFWSLVAQTSTHRGIAVDPAVGGFLNATPFTWFRYTQQTEQCNITTHTIYSDSGVASSPGGFN